MADFAPTPGSRAGHALKAILNLLPLFTSTKKGLVPLSGGGTTNFLRADGTFAAPPGTTTIPNFAPGGRLSLTSAVAVQTADVVSGATIYYVPYIHDQLPVVGLTLGSGVSLALDSNSGHTGYQQSGNVFDLFLYNNAGTLTLCTGPAWTNLTTRASAIDQTTVPGAWTNTASMTLRFGSASGNTLTAGAGTALYVGSMYASANGQCTCVFNPAGASGGSNPIVGLYNAYNKVPITSHCTDTGSWSTTTNSFVEWNSSTSNRVSYLDGLGDIASTVIVFGVIAVSSGGAMAFGALFNATSGSPNQQAYAAFAGEYLAATIIDRAPPTLGFNYWQGVYEALANTALFAGGATYNGITINQLG